MIVVGGLGTQTGQEMRSWRSELSNHTSNSKIMGKTTILLGEWLTLKEHCSEITFIREWR
jgi:hypothetical protein